jgi:hypothetical protein
MSAMEVTTINFDERVASDANTIFLIDCLSTNDIHQPSRQRWHYIGMTAKGTDLLWAAKGTDRERDRSILRRTARAI